LFSICCFIVVFILCSHISLCFHKMFSLCFHNCYLMALLGLFFWVTSIFILFITLMGFITYKIIICARFCHDIVTPSFLWVMSTMFHCASPLFASLNFLYYLQCQASLFTMHPIVHFLVCNASICAQFCYHITLFSFTRVHL